MTFQSDYDEEPEELVWETPPKCEVCEKNLDSYQSLNDYRRFTERINYALPGMRVCEDHVDAVREERLEKGLVGFNRVLCATPGCENYVKGTSEHCASHLKEVRRMAHLCKAANRAQGILTMDDASMEKYLDGTASEAEKALVQRIKIHTPIQGAHIAVMGLELATMRLARRRRLINSALWNLRQWEERTRR